MIGKCLYSKLCSEVWMPFWATGAACFHIVLEFDCEETEELRNGKLVHGYWRPSIYVEQLSVRNYVLTRFPTLLNLACLVCRVYKYGICVLSGCLDCLLSTLGNLLLSSCVALKKWLHNKNRVWVLHPKQLGHLIASQSLNFKDMKGRDVWFLFLWRLPRLIAPNWNVIWPFFNPCTRRLWQKISIAWWATSMDAICPSIRSVRIFPCRICMLLWVILIYHWVQLVGCNHSSTNTYIPWEFYS